MKNNRHHCFMPAGQQGIALIVVLLMLIIIAVIGTTSMNGTIMQEKMSGSQKEMSMSFNAAESGLRAAEDYLNQATIDVFDGTDGLFMAIDANVPDWKDGAHTGWVYRAGTLPDVNKQPEYIIEELPTVYALTRNASADVPLEEAPLYRVTSRGYGGSGQSNQVLQIVFKR